MALVSIFDNIEISLLTKGIIIRNIREKTMNMANMVSTADIELPK
jgi:hypothetical protein